MQPDHWEPDEQLVPAVLSRTTAARMSELGAPDRCWVVAGLTLAGLTAEDIADRLSCSLRLVRSLRAEPMTAVCSRMQTESSHFADELRLARSEQRHSALLLAAAELEVTRLRAQVGRMIRADHPRCSRGHDMSNPYNRYEHQGRTFCRECHRERQATYRAARRLEQR